jgi:hypothetical protein
MLKYAKQSTVIKALLPHITSHYLTLTVVNWWRLYEKLITCCLMMPHSDSLVLSTSRHVNILVSQLKSRNYTYLHLCGYMINFLNVYTCLIKGRYYGKHLRTMAGVTSPGTTAYWCADTEYCIEAKGWSNDLPFSV